MEAWTGSAPHLDLVTLEVRGSGTAASLSQGPSSLPMVSQWAVRRVKT